MNKEYPKLQERHLKYWINYGCYRNFNGTEAPILRTELSLDQRKNTFLYGDYGVGKTHLCAYHALRFLMINNPARVLCLFVNNHAKNRFSQEIESISPGYDIAGERKIFLISREDDFLMKISGHHCENMLVIADDLFAWPDYNIVTRAIDNTLTGNGTCLATSHWETGKKVPDYFENVFYANAMDHPNVKFGKNLIPGAIGWKDDR